jgi:hypothetical protein
MDQIFEMYLFEKSELNSTGLKALGEMMLLWGSQGRMRTAALPLMLVDVALLVLSTSVRHTLGIIVMHRLGVKVPKMISCCGILEKPDGSPAPVHPVGLIICMCYEGMFPCLSVRAGKCRHD